MEMQFPGDGRDARVRTRRNMSELERWGSVAAGTALTLYGLSRRRTGGVVLAIFGGLLIRRGATGHCDIYEALDLNTASTSSDTRRALSGKAGSHVEEASSSTGQRPSCTGSRASLENLPRFMQHLKSVEVIPRRSRGGARGPGGHRPVECGDHQRSSGQADRVALARGLRGRQRGLGAFRRCRGRSRNEDPRTAPVQPPGGKIGAAVVRLLGRDAATEIREDLLRFKQLLDAGEVATDRGSGTLTLA